MKTLHLKPIGSFCSRLLSLAAGYNMAIDQCRKFVIYWELDHEVNADLRKFFTFSDVEVYYKDKCNYPSKFLSFFDNKAKRACKRADFKFLDAHYQELIETMSREAIHQGFNFFMATPSLFIQTSTPFYPVSSYIIQKILQPKYFLMQEVAKVKEVLGEKYIGIHVAKRALDSFNQEPIESLFSKFLLDKYGDDFKVFLSTDCSYMYERFKNLFGDRVFSFNNIKTTRTAKGSQDALVDMFALSQSEHIYAGMPTGFNEFASIYGNKPLTIIPFT